MARATLVVAALVAFVTVAVRPLVPASAGHPVTGRAMAQEDPDPELYLPLALRQAAPVPVVTATPTPPPGSAPATDIPPHDTATAVPWTTTPGRTPEVTSTPIPGYADLAIGSVTIAMEDSRCYYGQPLGTLLRVDNVGAGAAGSFVVEANGVRQAVPFGLAPGGWRDVWFPGYDGGNTVAIVDVTGAVAESNEDNNRHGGPVPIPTPPPSCPAPTPAASPPDLFVLSMWIGFEDHRCHYGQPLGTVVSLANQGGSPTGSFVLEVNGKRRAIAEGLAAGAGGTWWLPTYRTPEEGETVVVADAAGGVVEALEDNNERRETLVVPAAPPPCPTGTGPPASFSLRVIRPAIMNSIPGQRCVFLVIAESEGEFVVPSPITLSAAAPGAQASVVPEYAGTGWVAEVTIIPAYDQQESTVPISIRAVRGGEAQEVAVSLRVLADIPGVDAERGAHAATVRDRFVRWLEVTRPYLLITTTTPWTGTLVTPQTLGVMHYLFYSPEWEMHVAWHPAAPPNDWARIDLRRRFFEGRPFYAFEIESWSAETEPRPTDAPDEIWR